ncbi:group 1 glycosyl transferase [Chondrocystis sp. NIES-4102]|nr:group 1 glycosyl transferase [Chondrocystis sp. NIES-4102]
MKITLVISALGCGGAERVLVLMAKGLIDRGHHLSVITLGNKETDFYQLPLGCSRLALGVMGQSSGLIDALKNNINRISILRKAVQSTDPDVVISFLQITNITTILALLGTKYPLIVTEHNNIKVFSYGLLWDSLRRLTYPAATKVVSVSKGVDLSFDLLPESKRAVIYNPIVVEDNGYLDPLPPEVDSEKHWLVSMGRLTYQKGFDSLLQAFSKVAHKYPNWQLLILGKGELEQELKQMRDDLGLSSNQVIFTGSLKNPFAVLKKAKFFAMASRNEGFPMAHGEALACGLPVIATDCPSGPNEMIRHELDGLLVPNQDIEALTLAMDSIMSDEQKRQQLAAHAKEVTERFGLENIINQWEILIKELIKK